MKTISRKTLLGALFIASLAISVLSLGCTEPTDKSEFQGVKNVLDLPVPYGSDLQDNDCLNGQDDDWDGRADRWGVPAHCTIGAPVQTTALGSVYRLTATGSFTDTESDIYTITVTTGGGSGAAQIQAVSNNGDTGNAIDAPATVTNGVAIPVGSFGLLLYFTDVNGTLNLVAGETWTVTTRWENYCSLQPDTNCYDPIAIYE